MRKRIKDLENSSQKKKRIKDRAVIYHSDTCSVAPQTSDYNICYSWQEVFEEISDGKVYPHIRVETTSS